MSGGLYYLTKKGLEKAQKKLEELEVRRLNMIKNRKPRALDYREVDTEYVTYQEELGQIEKRIHDLKKILDTHELIEAPENEQRDKVFLGATVVIDMAGSVEEFTIVGTFESDPAEQKISNISPLGKALLGRKEGEEFDVKTPMVTNSCRLIKIRYEGF